MGVKGFAIPRVYITVKGMIKNTTVDKKYFNILIIKSLHTKTTICMRNYLLTVWLGTWNGHTSHGP